MAELSKTEHLKCIQEYNFAAYDMLLYLDTHPCDKKAFSLYKELVDKTLTLKKDYENKFGPLTPYSAARFDEFKWTKGPWPWEKEANS